MPRFKNLPVDVVLDVRSKLEFWLGHLDGAINISVDSLADRLPDHPEITPDKRVLVYCASGGRSAAAASVLRGMGFSKVVDGGGIGAAQAEYSPAG
jgi:phage shock protein E